MARFFFVFFHVILDFACFVWDTIWPCERTFKNLLYLSNIRSFLPKMSSLRIILISSTPYAALNQIENRSFLWLLTAVLPKNGPGWNNRL